MDDHEIFRIGLREFLAFSGACEVVAEASTARAAFGVVQSVRPDVVLMDIHMPGMDGIVATREMLRRSPRIRVVILSAHDQDADVFDAMDAGAAAYVRKGDAPETLFDALNHVVRGDRYVAPALAARLSPLDDRRPGCDVLAALSEREREIFRLAADCRRASDIARDLCLARKTVDTHLGRIQRKLAVRDRAELVRFAAGIGLVHSLRQRIPELASECPPAIRA